MSFITDRYTLKKISGQSLAVIECGIQICMSGHITPLARQRYYSAHFILEGKGVYIFDGKEYPLSQGEGFLIVPGVECSYIADEKEPWRYIYATFRGIDETTLVHNAGLDEQTVTFSFDIENIEPLLYKMHAAGKKDEAKGYDVTGWFLLIISSLVANNLRKPPSEDGYIQRVKQYVEDNYPFPITVASMASHVCLERSYLYRIFMHGIGMSPSDYLRKYRLRCATELLKDRRLSVTEVADSVGFSDITHFHRVFRSQYGMTPKQYREALK